MRLSLFLLVAALAAPLALPASAQGRVSIGGSTPPATADVVTWTVRSDRARRGQTARVLLQAEIAPGWRLYALGSPVGRPLTVEVDPLPAGVRAGSLRQSEPRQGVDAALGERYPYFSGEARVVVPLSVGRTAATGTHEVTGTVRYAVCDDEICLPPATESFRVPLRVQAR